MSSGKDNQHFVPQAHLRGFTIPEERSLVWEYDKKIMAISRSPKSIRDICARDQYYAQVNDDGKVDKETLENNFHIIENVFPKILGNINPKNENEKIFLDEDSRAMISFYIGMQFTRVPVFRDSVHDLHRKIIKMGIHRVAEDQRKCGVLPPEVDKLLKKDGIRVEIDEWVSLEAMVLIGKQIAESIYDKCIQFLVAHKEVNFITSDNPARYCKSPKINIIKQEEVGAAHPFSNIHIPLRRDLAVGVSPPKVFGGTLLQRKAADCRSIFLTKQQTNEFNRGTARAAMRYVYAGERSEGMASMIFKFKEIKQLFGS